MIVGKVEKIVMYLKMDVVDIWNEKKRAESYCLLSLILYEKQGDERARLLSQRKQQRKEGIRKTEEDYFEVARSRNTIERKTEFCFTYLQGIRYFLNEVDIRNGNSFTESGSRNVNRYTNLFSLSQTIEKYTIPKNGNEFYNKRLWTCEER
ncbi:hypothetical protein EYC80_004834 [Monilinia laxa]|uniref:Uncharacterized protein n=1 Tax=Monilinia laxa TaxID=61186 RepID=A0A5N6KI04_MONLA|nr:hypothetical protein EYC80_004834 [Monilinia laxa]